MWKDKKNPKYLEYKHRKNKRYRERYPEKHRVTNRIWSNKEYQKRKAKSEEYFGNTCWICGEETIRGKKHEINGLFHEQRNPLFYINNKERFILLCYNCHVAFHTFMRFGYNIEEIIKILGLIIE